MEPRLGKRLVLFPLPLQGHQNPMLQLAQILYSKGFSISVIHFHLNSPNYAYFPHFTFHSIPCTEFGPLDTSSDRVLGLLSLLNANLGVRFRDLLSQILLENDVADEPVACLITDAMWYFTQDVADSLKVPRIVLRTSSLSSFLSFTSLSLLKEKGYLSAQGGELEEPVPELPPLKVKDITVLCTRDTEKAYQLVFNLMEKARASRGLIFNSFEELEGSSLALIRKDMSIPIFALGPFHKQVPTSPSHRLSAKDQSCISWLNAQQHKSVLYVSFGSIIALDEAEFQEIAWGLANSKQPFLWVVRPGLVRHSNGTSLLSNGFLEMVADRGRVIEWAPQEEVLAHPAIGGFWTHSGWNSTLESISEGVAMLCLPCFGDQRTNARYVCDEWRVGLQFEEGLKRDDIEKAIRKLTQEKDGIEMRNRIACLKEKAKRCIAKEGSSVKSLDSLVAYILSF